MGAPVKPIKDLIEKTFDIAGDIADEQFVNLDKIRNEYVEEINLQVALAYARKLGLSPIETLEETRKRLNERIIVEMEARKLKHREVAAISQVQRTRVTAIKNRHLERVSLDMLFIILNRLGIDPKTLL